MPYLNKQYPTPIYLHIRSDMSIYAVTSVRSDILRYEIFQISFRDEAKHFYLQYLAARAVRHDKDMKCFSECNTLMGHCSDKYRKKNLKINIQA